LSEANLKMWKFGNLKMKNKKSRSLQSQFTEKSTEMGLNTETEH
jgi:hypothetical protein